MFPLRKESGQHDFRTFLTLIPKVHTSCVSWRVINPVDYCLYTGSRLSMIALQRVIPCKNYLHIIHQNNSIRCTPVM